MSGENQARNEGHETVLPAFAISNLVRREIQTPVAVCLPEAFNPRKRLLRTQTIMEGADYCDFRFVLE
jgi:hypothetical protein